MKPFNETLETLPEMVIARDLSMHHQTFAKLIEHPERFTFKGAFRIAKQIEVEETAILNLIYNHHVKKKAGRLKNSTVK